MFDFKDLGKDFENKDLHDQLEKQWNKAVDAPPDRIDAALEFVNNDIQDKIATKLSIIAGATFFFGALFQIIVSNANLPFWGKAVGIVVLFALMYFFAGYMTSKVRGLVRANATVHSLHMNIMMTQEFIKHSKNAEKKNDNSTPSTTGTAPDLN